MDRILSQKTIEQVTFNKKLFGIDEKEVDKFLYTISVDYDRFEEELRELRKTKLRILNEIRLKENQSKENSNSGYKMLGIVKRLSRLEDEVFKDKLEQD